MLKFLSKVRIEFNALDPRIASCMEFLAQCNARKAKESNPSCQVQVKRRTDDYPPKITVTFVNGVEETFDATSTPAQTIRTLILDKGSLLETEQMFREAGEQWPVIVPEEELRQPFTGIKVRIEFNALDPRIASCMEFLAQCNARKAKESNPSCQVQVKRRTDDYPPKITVTFVNGVEETFDATSTPAQTIRTLILDKGSLLETEQMFRDAGEQWPVIVPEEELRQPFTGIKPRKAEEKKQ
ncbi:unnamed protein product [Fraxinus pennsylvanica]|uniref:Large ribosomal subunit protein mL53 n=1 Tax=Fraxinus pennsylvanica TaxID=56036 RepID=A0AAD2A398_9LAMI|nr:unnamed protein product [Fraxinus pennsylvanica]